MSNYTPVILLLNFLIEAHRFLLTIGKAVSLVLRDGGLGESKGKFLIRGCEANVLHVRLGVASEPSSGPMERKGPLLKDASLGFAIEVLGDGSLVSRRMDQL